jgi:signal transduction histidine kinase/ActR/RegA family two-component response regulator
VKEDASQPPSPLLLPLASPDQRAAAADALAAELGAARVLLYVKDPQLEVMLPAPGMPKSLRGGPRWREFLKRCLTEAQPAGRVDLDDRDVPARAMVAQRAALIVLGEPRDAALLEAIGREFPLLAAALVAQQALHYERAAAAEARDAATQAQHLAHALDRARAAAAELNRQLREEHDRKDEFLAMLSHELRNPLVPLVNSVELLRHAGSDTAGTRQLEVMARQLQQLTHVVDDLLDVSRVSRGLIELRRERIPLDEILDDAVEAVRPVLEERRHALVRARAGDVLVNGDRVRLTQVFINLLSNAARYTGPGGRITVSIVLDQHRVSVVVQDTGVGIPQDMLTSVFDMFMQVPSSRSLSAGGLGIGLTLARRLAELHGGRISAYSRGMGHGSTFTVSLPQVQVAAGPARSAPTPPRQPAVPTTGPRPRVLVVEDNRDGAETLVALIGYMGGTAKAAADGPEALRIAAEFEPHLVLLDIGLPGIDGYETAARLRRLPGFDARLVALTGYGSAQDRERALAAGFDEHLVKPLSPDAMRDLLRRLPAMQDAS